MPRSNNASISTKQQRLQQRHSVGLLSASELSRSLGVEPLLFVTTLVQINDAGTSRNPLGSEPYTSVFYGQPVNCNKHVGLNVRILTRPIVKTLYVKHAVF